MERQAVGLRYKPALMLIDDADTPAKWYYKLKAAHLASVQTGQPLDHPLKERVTLRWKSDPHWTNSNRWLGSTKSMVVVSGPP